MRFVFLMLLLSILFLGTSGCQVAHWTYSDDVVARRGLFVEVEQWTFKGDEVDKGYAHPVQLRKEDVAAILRQLTLKTGRRGKKTQPVVSEQVLPLLAEALVVGLGKASSSQRVRFSVSNPKRVLGFIPSGTVSRGVVFVREIGTLDFAFDVLDESLGVDESTWRDPTRRSRSAGRLNVPDGAMRHTTDEGKEKRHWLRIPVKTAAVDPMEKEAIREKLSDKEVLDRLRLLEKKFRNGEISEDEYRGERERLLFVEG